MQELDALIAAAKHERWEFVDSAIAEIVGDPTYYKWAHSKGMKDGDRNVRDLAVSIIERSIIPEDEFSFMGRDLHALMLKDDNPYVRFRAAFAFANHQPRLYKEEVIAKLEEAKKDKDVKDIAKAYLAKLRPRIKINS